MSSVTPAIAQHAPRMRLRRALSWALIVGTTGLFMGWLHLTRAKQPIDPWYLWGGVFFLSFPILYVLGFRRYLPESIGGVAAPARGDEPRRWRSFLRTALGLALLPQAGFMLLQVIGDVPKPLETLGLVARILPVTFLTFLFFTLLGKAVGAVGAPTTEGGAPAPKRSLLGRIAGLLSPGVSLRSASVLVLATLITATSARYGCGGDSLYRGHEIVRGKADWFTVEYLSEPGFFTEGRWTRLLAETDRALYVLALALALFTLVATARRRPRFGTRQLTWLRGVSGAIALWAVSDLLWLCFFFLWGSARAWPFLYVLWLLLWLAPPLLWARRVTSIVPHAPEGWRHLRAFLVIVWLPIVGTAYTLVWAGSEAYGYVIFFFAVELLWWGYVTQPAIADEPAPVEAGA